MIDGFKKFISRGNMIDMAVGVVMGGAVTAVVNAIVNHLINPLIAMIFGYSSIGRIRFKRSCNRGYQLVSG